MLRGVSNVECVEKSRRAREKRRCELPDNQNPADEVWFGRPQTVTYLTTSLSLPRFLSPSLPLCLSSNSPGGGVFACMYVCEGICESVAHSFTRPRELSSNWRKTTRGFSKLQGVTNLTEQLHCLNLS